MARISHSISNIAKTATDRGRPKRTAQLMWRTIYRSVVLVCLLAGTVTVASELTARAHAAADRQVLYQRAYDLAEAGKYGKALSVAERTLKLTEKQFGRKHRRYRDVQVLLADIHSNLSFKLYKASRYAKAEKHGRQALELREEAVGQFHKEVARDVSNLAFIYRERGRHKLAESSYRRALNIREKALGSNHPKVAESLHSLAFFYHRTQGHYELAEPFYLRARIILEKLPGKGRSKLATTLNNLATLYRAQGRLELAEPLHEQALHIREEVLGENHPEVAISLTNLAVVYQAQGRDQQVEAFYKRALQIREEALGKNHPDVATSLAHLMAYYWKWGHRDKAEALQKRYVGILAQRPAALRTRSLIDNTEYPWKAIGQVNFQRQGGCTGALVAPDVVLTAAHCLYNWQARRWVPARSIHFVAGYRSGKYVFHSRAASYRRAEEFDPSLDKQTLRGARPSDYNRRHDWAIIKLKKSAGPEVGYLGVAKLTRDFGFPTAPVFMLAGYGRDRRHALAGDRACRLLGWWEETARTIVHNCRAVKGFSGAPIIGVRDGRYFVYAVDSVSINPTEEESLVGLGGALPSMTFFEAVKEATGRTEITLKNGLVALLGRAAK